MRSVATPHFSLPGFCREPEWQSYMFTYLRSIHEPCRIMFFHCMLSLLSSFPQTLDRNRQLLTMHLLTAITTAAEARVAPLQAQLAGKPYVFHNPPPDGAPSKSPTLQTVDAIPVLVPIRPGSSVSRAKMVGCRVKKAPVKKPYRMIMTKRPARFGPALKESTMIAIEVTDATIIFNGPRRSMRQGMLGSTRPNTEAPFNMDTKYSAVLSVVIPS